MNVIYVMMQVEVPVMVVMQGFRTGMLDTRCSVVEVREDDTCQCGCDVTPDMCSHARHVYNKDTCECTCSNRHEAATCTDKDHVWDPRTCSCTCHRDTWKLCPTGYLFDSSVSCTCVPIHYPALPPPVMIVSSIILMVVIVVTYILYCRKRSQMRQRRESLARVLEVIFRANIK